MKERLLDDDDVFVNPTVTRIPLSRGRWIDVKTELTAGEKRHVFGRLVKEMRSGESALLDPEQVGFTRLAEYIVGWSFTSNGKVVPVTESAINGLRPDIYVEIVAAIDAHEAAIDALNEAKKKDPDTSTASEAT